MLTFRDYPVKPPEIQCLDLELKHFDIEAEGYIEEEDLRPNFRIPSVIQDLLFSFKSHSLADGFTAECGFRNAELNWYACAVIIKGKSCRTA